MFLLLIAVLIEIYYPKKEKEQIQNQSVSHEKFCLRGGATNKKNRKKIIKTKNKKKKQDNL